MRKTEDFTKETKNGILRARFLRQKCNINTIVNYCQTGNLATAKDALSHDWINVIWGLGRVNYKMHYGSHRCSSNMEKFTFDSAVRGYHVNKDVWKPTIGEKLQADQELGNEADKFAVKVVKNNEIVGHLPREYL